MVAQLMYEVGTTIEQPSFFSQRVSTVGPELPCYTTVTSVKQSVPLRLAQHGIRQICVDALKAGRHDIAVQVMRESVSSRTRILAQSFGKRLEHESLAPLLIQDLADERVLTEAECARLTVLLMVIDGLDVEVNEYGGELDAEDVEFAQEYTGIIESVMSRHGTPISSIVQSVLYHINAPSAYVTHFSGLCWTETWDERIVILGTNVATNSQATV